MLAPRSRAGPSGSGAGACGAGDGAGGVGTGACAPPSTGHASANAVATSAERSTADTETQLIITVPVSRNRRACHKSRSAAPGSQGATTEDMAYIRGRSNDASRGPTTLVGVVGGTRDAPPERYGTNYGYGTLEPSQAGCDATGSGYAAPVRNTRTISSLRPAMPASPRTSAVTATARTIPSSIAA